MRPNIKPDRFLMLSFCQFYNAFHYNFADALSLVIRVNRKRMRSHYLVGSAHHAPCAAVIPIIVFAVDNNTGIKVGAVRQSIKFTFSKAAANIIV